MDVFRGGGEIMLDFIIIISLSFLYLNMRFERVFLKSSHLIYAPTSLHFYEP